MVDAEEVCNEHMPQFITVRQGASLAMSTTLGDPSSSRWLDHSSRVRVARSLETQNARHATDLV